MNRLNGNTRNKSLTTRLVIMSFLIALIIILSRILAINMSFLRLSFEFIPTSFIGIMFGPIWGGALVALADFIGVILFPTSGSFNPMFTISALLTGFIYGLFLHKKEITIKRVLVPVIVICLGIHFILNTFWLSIILDSAFVALVPARLIKAFVLMLIEPILIVFLWNRLKRFLPI